MFYLAKWRVKIAGQIMLPGEVFEAELTEANAQRLLKLGAIAEAMPGDAATAEAMDAPLPQTEAPETTEDETEEAEAPEAANDEDEADDDAPVPVIDVMDGVVEAPAAEVPAKKTSGGRKRK